jgi:Uma2 family endonuclease
MTVKVPRYAAALIPEVWIINVNNETVVQYLQPQDGKYLEEKTYQRGDDIQTSLSFTVPVNAIFK